MKYLGKITDNKDLVTKEYVDNAVLIAGGGLAISTFTISKDIDSSSERVRINSGSSSKTTLLSTTSDINGVALISGYINFTASSSGNRDVSVDIDGNTVFETRHQGIPSNTARIGFSGVGVVSENSIISISVWQSSGSTMYSGGELNITYLAQDESLKDTTWQFNSTLNTPIPADLQTGFNITFMTNNNSYAGTKIYGADDELVYYSSVSTPTNKDVYSSSWIGEQWRTIHILGGTDIKNANLIAWLQLNATQL